MRKFVLAAAVVAALGATTVGSAQVQAQGCGGAGGMCAPPGAAGQQAMPGMPMQQATPGAPAQQATPGTGMMGGGMCGCCRQMAMMQPGAQGGTGSTPRPPSGDQPAPGGAPPAQ